MHHEGQRVSRRRLIAGVGSLGLGALVAACTSGGQPVTTSTGETVVPRATTADDLTSLFDGANTCTLTPATTAGPFYFDADKVRSDIREDREGVRLRVAVKVQDSGSCTPIKDAVVEIWHCDAGGLYSGAEAMSRGSGDLTPQDDQRYLRGAQVTNADGIVEFTTIWPGWYPGRCVHIHAMVHISDARVLTTQVMFDEALNDRVLAENPYAARGDRNTRNETDGIFREEMLMKVTPDGDGYLGAIVFAADPGQNGR
ncbi:intradiol ring-cleavage dioxygenase [Nonomuraea sp. NPDC049649]|uniref:intradiol ring-cleavage dioxygenase n=1 Tax=Nonomuraea sp. NPDC049649 TaxID=3155776 RepID=UPI00343026B1